MNFSALAFLVQARNGTFCFSGSSSGVGITIKPRSFRLGSAATSRANCSASSGFTPLFVSSPSTFTSIRTLSGVRYPAGKISTYANVENSIIKSVKIYGDFFGIGDVSDIEDLLVGVPYEYEDVLAKLKTIDTTHYFSRMTTEEVAKAIVA